jgi:hypothetical protein
LGELRLDSLNQVEEEDEAHPPVPSERRGMVRGGGTMVRTVVAVGVSPLCLFREEGEKGRWRSGVVGDAGLQKG